MEKTSAFVKVLENPTKFNNEVLSAKIEALYQFKDTLKRVKETLDMPIEGIKKLYENDEDVIEMYEDEDIRKLTILEIIESMNNKDLQNMQKFAKEIGIGYYFKTMQAGDCLYNALVSGEAELTKLTSAINNDKAIDCNASSERLYNMITDLNYGLICSLKLFKESAGEVYACVKFWEIKYNRNFKEFATECNEYYKTNKPNLGLFAKYPDLALKIEEVLDEATFLEFVNLSNYAEYEELISIASNLKQVDDEYLMILKDRKES